MSHTPFPGEELRQRREEFGLSIDDVYRKIRIPIRYIRALESDDVSDLPTPAYSVGFIKTYCEFLQLRSARYIDFYHGCLQPEARTFLRGRNRAAENQPPRPMPTWAQNAMPWAVVLAVMALGWFSWHVVVRSSATPPEPAAAGTFERVEPPAPTLLDE